MFPGLDHFANARQQEILRSVQEPHKTARLPLGATNSPAWKLSRFGRRLSTAIRGKTSARRDGTRLAPSRELV